MKPYLLPVLFLCFQSSCQPVNKDDKPVLPVRVHQLREPDHRQLRRNLFTYFERHRSEEQFDTLDDTYQRLVGGPANYPPYRVTAGYLFHDYELHAMIYYSDEQGAGLFVYTRKNGDWLPILTDTSATVMAGNSSPQFKDWNGDGTKDLCLYYAPALSMSVIGNYALWLMSPDGNQLRYIHGFDQIENPKLDTMTGKIIGSYYYHGERRSEYRLKKDTVIKIKETWDKEDS